MCMCACVCVFFFHACQVPLSCCEGQEVRYGSVIQLESAEVNTHEEKYAYCGNVFASFFSSAASKGSPHSELYSRSLRPCCLVHLTPVPAHPTQALENYIFRRSSHFDGYRVRRTRPQTCTTVVDIDEFVVRVGVPPCRPGARRSFSTRRRKRRGGPTDPCRPLPALNGRRIHYIHCAACGHAHPCTRTPRCPVLPCRSTSHGRALGFADRLGSEDPHP